MLLAFYFRLVFLVVADVTPLSAGRVFLAEQPPLLAGMLLILLVFSLSLASTAQEVDEDDWIDPHDMLHYDATTKTMRKPAEVGTPHTSSLCLNDGAVCS